LIRSLGSVLVTALLLSGCAANPVRVPGPEPTAPAGSSAATPSPVQPPAGKVSGEIAASKKAAGIEACPAAETRQAVGADALPSVVLPCLGGGTAVRLSSLLGQPTVINVWASWCAPCRKELPLLERAHREHGDRVRFLGVDAGDPDASVAIALLDELGITFPQVADSSMQTRGTLGYGGGLPLTIFVDAQGRMAGTERLPFRSYSAVGAALHKHLGVT
jgi:cytochrome c biogenesis protein CcmG, thiol:disulfide interchange protein DsbE